MTEPQPRIVVSVYLRGQHLDPEVLSAALGIQPTSLQVAGRLRPGSERFIANIGLWGVSSESISSKIADHVDDVLSHFKGVYDPLTGLHGVEEAYLDVLVAFENPGAPNATVECFLSREQIVSIARLGLGVQLSVM